MKKIKNSNLPAIVVGKFLNPNRHISSTSNQKYIKVMSNNLLLNQLFLKEKSPLLKTANCASFVINPSILFQIP